MLRERVQCGEAAAGRDSARQQANIQVSGEGEGEWRGRERKRTSGQANER